ncbi:MAG: sigma-54-dependent Fis family transcriptional regulator [Deltaproteobacteria bacterium]|nr:sigma-54-dependent Fis family transcriptional regulator [Deltaproteobacteria bacterium]
MSRVLLVDDEPAVLFTLKEVLEERGHSAVLAASGAEALTKLDGVDAAVTDLSMPGMDGLALLARLRERDESLPVVLLTAHGSEKIAVQAMKAGAYDYVTKPFDIDEMALVVDRALEARSLRVQNRHLEAEVAVGRRIVGESTGLKRVLDAVARIAPRDVTVLLRGETGTGKELIASMIHAQSKRKNQELVRFNCAAIPGDLAEAELFGHARGAFTGAVAARRGFFAQADKGTLVLDEVGELPLGVQAKLLRAIQEGEIQPVGSGRVEKVDVRIVASTNRDLQAEVKAGRFREDLYYRLAVVDLTVPPLRERREDIPLLALEFGRRYGERFGISDVKLSPALVERLAQSEWPGNVRELENTIARMIALAPSGTLGLEALTGVPQVTNLAAAPVSVTTPPGGIDLDAEPPAADNALSLREQVEAFERGLIARALANAGGNQSEAARRLGTSRVTLIDKIKKYGLQGTGT